MRKLLNRLFVRPGRRQVDSRKIELPSPSHFLYLREKYPQHEIGPGSYGPLVIKSWGEGAKLIIGNYCSFAEGAKVLLGGEHRSDWITTYPFNILWEEGKNITGHPLSKGNVTIGHDVWVGTDAIILSGVTIGTGAIVGARAVVTKNVPPFGIVVGNPARMIRKRFDDETIEKLLQVAWWNWSREKIAQMLPLLQNNRIDEFFTATSSSPSTTSATRE